MYMTISTLEFLEVKPYNIDAKTTNMSFSRSMDLVSLSWGNPI